MRFLFESLARPTELAHSLGAHLSGLGFILKPDPLLDLVSRMTGFADWEDLARHVGTAPAGIDDDLCEPEVVRARRRAQVAELRALGLTELQAVEAVAATHPTNRLPDLEVAWHPHEGGRFTVEDGKGYWVGPNLPGSTESRRPRVNFGLPGDEDRPFHMRYCKPSGDGVAFDEAYGPHGYRSLEDAVARVERTVRDARLQRRDERLLTRTKLTVDEARAIDAPWGTSTEFATLHDLGVLQVSCDRHGGFGVPPEVVETIPEVLRSWQCDEGYAWYEEDCQASLLVLALPALFTQPEIRDARMSAARTYPAILAILDGHAPSDPASVRKAKRGFTEERITWGLVNRDDPDADGMVRVQAVISDYWGVNPPSREEMMRPRTFLVPASELAGHDDVFGPRFEIDPDRHEMVEAEDEAPSMRH